MRHLHITAAAICCILVAVFHSLAAAHENPAAGENNGNIGIIERTGENIPLDAVFYDEQGNAMPLKQLFGMPVVLSLVYYGCDRVCPTLLAAVADIPRQLHMTPGKDYRLVTISFDPNDNAHSARDAKKNYIILAGAAFPEKEWSFLTGSSDNINKVLAATGFSVKKDELHGYSHPSALVVLSGEGKIVRYIYSERDSFSMPHPLAFQTFDLSLAIGDAAKGKTGFSIKRALLYCFPHQPKNQEAFFNILKISGFIIVFSVMAFFTWLLTGRKRQPGGGK